MDIDSGRSQPAAARAAQVDAAVRLERATGLPASAPAAEPGQMLTSPPGGPAGAAPSMSVLLGERANATDQALPSTPRAEDAATTGRVLRGLTTMINQRGGTMSMRLDPPELGQIRVQMTLARGVVTAQFTAATEQARSLLERNLGVLRTALESQGLTVERLQVHVQPTNLGQHGFGDAADHDDAAQHDAGNGQSRGRSEQEAGEGRRGQDRAFFDQFLDRQPDAA